MAQAFICGLKSGPAPVNPNSVDTLTGEAVGGGIGALGAGWASATSSSSGTPQGTVQWPLHGTAASPVPLPTPNYSTIQQPLALAYAPPPIEQEPSLYTMARQTAAGYRLAGPLLNGISGGGAEGIDLLPQARRVLHAQQVLLGIRAPGPLTSTPPAGGLPTVASYAPILYSSGAAAAGALPPPPVGPPPPLYTTVQTSTGGFGGGGGPGAGAGANGQRRPESTYTSDELCIPYSTGMLGSFSPYRSSPYPRELTCFECQAVQHHYATECPSRFVRVRGEAPPGWRVDTPGRAVKDDAAWNGQELTDAARARYLEFVAKFSLPAHGAFPITVEEIVGTAPVPMRCLISRPGRGIGRRLGTGAGPTMSSTVTRNATCG